jgi:hypothetical protein
VEVRSEGGRRLFFDSDFKTNEEACNAIQAFVMVKKREKRRLGGESAARFQTVSLTR